MLKVRKAQIIKVKDKDLNTKEVFDILTGLKKKQKEIKNTEKVFFPQISFYHALKYNIFYKNLLLHPLVLKKKGFSEEKRCLKTKKELEALLKSVLEYELTTTDKEFLLKEERDAIIQAFRTLQKKAKKNQLVQTSTT